MGSGKVLKRAIKKHGIENFQKEILHVYNTPEEMWDKERELVYVSEETYNLREGGSGGFAYVNSGIITSENRSLWGKMGREQQKRNMTEKYGENWQSELRKNMPPEKLQNMMAKLREGHKRYIELNGTSVYSRSHTEETKRKQSMVMKGRYDGDKNPNFGNRWVTNDKENRLVAKNDLDNWLKLGYRFGRVITPD